MIMYETLDIDNIIYLHIRNSQQNETITVNTDTLPSRWNLEWFLHCRFFYSCFLWKGFIKIYEKYGKITPNPTQHFQ